MLALAVIATVWFCIVTLARLSKYAKTPDDIFYTIPYFAFIIMVIWILYSHIPA